MIILGVAFALAYEPLTIVATDGVGESQQGVATTAGVTTGDGMLDGYRAALTVPIAAATLAAAINASGLRPVQNIQ
ncbi:hypothetical protein ACWCOT_41125 [Nonomuraea bangladeshensis]